MNDETSTVKTTGHDITLISWFLSLSPDERLAELESRIAFFNNARKPDGESELPANPGNS